MGQVARARTRTFIFNVTTAPIAVDIQDDGNRYDYIIVKNEAGSAAPVMCNVGPTAIVAAAVYPTAGDATTKVPQVGKTVLPGHSESYRKQQESGFVGLVSSGNCTVHVTLGVDP